MDGDLHIVIHLDPYRLQFDRGFGFPAGRRQYDLLFFQTGTDPGGRIYVYVADDQISECKILQQNRQPGSAGSYLFRCGRDRDRAGFRSDHTAWPF